MYEEQIGKRVRATLKDGHAKFGLLEAIEPATEEHGLLLRIRKDDGLTAYVAVDQAAAVEEIGEGRASA
jgi:geranylgeranyl pyrophosphate synthase